MAGVYSFNDYREFLRAHATQEPGKRSGELTRMAAAAGIFPSYLSQILNGRRDLNLDQAVKVADHCGMKKPERRYFLLLVQLARAGSQRLKDETLSEMEDLRENHLRLSSRLPNQRELSLSEMTEFYSTWQYIAIRLYTAIPAYQTVSSLSAKLGVGEKQVRVILDFLVKTGLCVEYEAGKYSYTTAHMHLASDQPTVLRHHANWRLYALNRHAILDPARELAYSGIFALSAKDVYKIRALLPGWIDQVREITDPSPSRQVFCLNLDWCEV
jgi:uncharacterized protein (TIGR02147 family)